MKEIVKMKNYEMVAFLKEIPLLAEKKLPMEFSFFLIENTEALNGLAKAYDKAVEKINEPYKDKEGASLSEEDMKKFEELRNLEVEASLSVIEKGRLIEMFQSGEYDTLKLGEIADISIMLK